MQHWQLVNASTITVSNTAEDLWSNATEYFKWCDEHPIEIKKTLVSGKEAGKIVLTETPRPYSVKGLCIHCGILQEYIRDIQQTKDKSSKYYMVISTILYLIFVQNQELAMIGVYNPVFTQRVLNMDKDDTPVSAITVNVVHGLPQLSNSESEVLEKLDLDMLMDGKLSIEKS